MADKANAIWASVATAAAVKGHTGYGCCCGFEIFPSAAFLSQVVFAGIFKGGDSLVDNVAPVTRSASRVDHWQWSMWQAPRNFFRESLYRFFGTPLLWWPVESSPYWAILGSR